jgi:hypothetical protein
MRFGQQDAGAETIEPRRYQTNVNLNQAPAKDSDRPVREYVTNVTRRPNRITPAA